MIFSENTNLRPGGESASPSKLKELDNKIDDLAQTVTSVADSVADLADEVTTAELNATSANVTNAVIDNATVGTETATTVNATTANADTLNATDADITNLTADDVDANSVDADNGYFGSVNAQSFTGQGVNITGDITASNKVQGKTVQATEKVVTPALESTETELKGKTVVRGDVQFPENGDKIYGEYLDVEANNLQAKSLTTQTPSGSSQLVGYDLNGKLIPVDASLDPANLWENDPDEENTIRPKDEKFIKTSGIIADEGDIAELNCGDFASENVTADDVTITTSLNSEGSATFDSADVTNDATVGGDLDVDGDTTLDDTTVDGTLQVNGDIIQNGSAYETHAEKVYTKDDLIITRDGAVSALGADEVTGIQAEKYDGTNDGQLVFDRNGEARVGDVGDTEPLMTRDELANMTDARPLVWDGTNNKAVTGSSGQADALNSGITASDVTKLSGIEAGAQANVQADWDQTDSTADDYIKNKPGLTVDASLDPTSNNSVRNSAICAGLNMGAVCNTGGSTSTKTVSIDGFVLQEGSRVTVMFTYGNSGGDPTLNVSSTGAKSIKVVKAGAKVTPIVHTGNWRGGLSRNEMWQPYTTLELLYDGTDWVIVGNPVVESYEDGAGNGYHVYADGKIEQWGSGNADSNHGVTFSNLIDISNSIILGSMYYNTSPITVGVKIISDTSIRIGVNTAAGGARMSFFSIGY